MAYSDAVATRIRERFRRLPEVEEKAMMGGLVFMVDDKMCVGVVGEGMMVRLDRDVPTVLARAGCRPMDITGRRMNGFVVVEPEGMESREDFEFWIGLALEFNTRAKSSKKARARRPPAM